MRLQMQGSRHERISTPKEDRCASDGFACHFNDALQDSGAENSEKQTYELGLQIDRLRLFFGSRWTKGGWR